MTVAELIEELRKYPPDMRIVSGNPGYHDYLEIKIRKGIGFSEGSYLYDDDGNRDRPEVEAIFIGGDLLE